MVMQLRLQGIFDYIFLWWLRWETSLLGFSLNGFFVRDEWNDGMMFTGLGEVCTSGGVQSATESALLRRPASVHVSEVH